MQSSWGARRLLPGPPVQEHARAATAGAPSQHAQRKEGTCSTVHSNAASGATRFVHCQITVGDLEVSHPDSSMRLGGAEQRIASGSQLNLLPEGCCLHINHPQETPRAWGWEKGSSLHGGASHLQRRPQAEPSPRLLSGLPPLNLADGGGNILTA